MPTYVYQCENCEHQFETIQKMTDDPLTECPECKGKIRRLLFPVGIVFKGSGFHVNDYPNSKSCTSGNGKNDDAATEAKKETASSSKS